MKGRIRGRTDGREWDKIQDRERVTDTGDRNRREGMNLA